MLIKKAILLAALFSMLGCTSMRPVEMEQADFTDYIETGDHLIVYEKYGRVLDMKVAKVEPTVIQGSLAGAGWSTVMVELPDVEKIEIERISGAKTTGAVVGGIILLPIFVAFAGLGAAAEMQ
jgi:hypothetical protein